MKRLHLMIKNINDFGKEKVTSTKHYYTQHYPEYAVGDIALYYYPKGDPANNIHTAMLGVYYVTEITKRYSEDDGAFQVHEGILKRTEKTINELEVEFITENNPLYEVLKEVVFPAIRKYNPELYETQ